MFSEPAAVPALLVQRHCQQRRRGGGGLNDLMAAAAPVDLVSLPGLFALGAQDFPAQQRAAMPLPRALFGRLIAQSPAQWAAFDPHAPFSLSYSAPMPLVFATDAAGVGELLAHRADARAALRHVGWTAADVAAYASSKLVKLVVFEAPPAPPATWDEVLNAALPTVAAAACGPPGAWSPAPAANARFVRALQEQRSLVVGAGVDSREGDADRSVEAFLKDLDEGRPAWSHARRVLARVLWLDDLFDGSGRTRKPDGSAGCNEYLVASSAPADARVAVLEFSVA